MEVAERIKLDVVKIDVVKKIDSFALRGDFRRGARHRKKARIALGNRAPKARIAPGNRAPKARIAPGNRAPKARIALGNRASSVVMRNSRASAESKRRHLKTSNPRVKRRVFVTCQSVVTKGARLAMMA